MTLRLGCAAALLFCTPAFAGDISLPGGPVAPAFSWGGFYVGAQVGQAFGRDNTQFQQEVTTTRAGQTTATPISAAMFGGPAATAAATASERLAVAAPAAAVAATPATGTAAQAAGATAAGSSVVEPVATPTTFTLFPPPTIQGFGADGFIGGGHLGYNVATRPFGGGAVGVFGIEGDVDGSSYRRPSTGIIYGPGYTFVPISASLAGISSDIQGSVRGRVGVAVNRVLVYATGGVAFAEFKSNFDFPDAINSFSHTRTGYTVGGGVEYAVTNNIALRLEYRYSDFGSFTDTIANVGPITGSTISHHETMERVQGGVSYLFTSPVAPTLARY